MVNKKRKEKSIYDNTVCVSIATRIVLQGIKIVYIAWIIGHCFLGGEPQEWALWISARHVCELYPWAVNVALTKLWVVGFTWAFYT